MSSVRILLIAGLLCLLNQGVVFAEDIDLGTWDIYCSDNPHNLHGEGTYGPWNDPDASPLDAFSYCYYENGYSDLETGPLTIDVIEKSDGSIYGSAPLRGVEWWWWDRSGDNTLNGSISGNSITFQIISAGNGNDNAGQGWYSSGTITATRTFSGTISGSGITGTSEGSGEEYSANYWANGNVIAYAFLSASFNGPFTIDTSKGKPPIPPQNIRQDPSPDNRLGKPKDPNQTVGDPINSVTGNMHIITTDLSISAPGIDFSFTRTYNNQAGQADGPLGFGWTHSYNVYLKEDTAANTVKIKDEEAKGYIFSLNTDGIYIPQWGEYSTLAKNANGFVWTKKDGKAYIFDLSGRFVQIRDRNNNAVNLSYDGQNHLTVITDTASRVVNLSYNSDGRISGLTDMAGRTISYSYDASGNLTTVTDPLGHTIAYEYDSNHNITKKIDALGKAVSFTYDDKNRCTSSTAEDNVGLTTLSFDPDNKKTTITDSRGNVTTQYYNDDLMITKTVNAQGGEVLSIWDPNFNFVSRADELGHTAAMQYNSKGNLIKVTDPAGNGTSFAYEPNYNLIQSSTDALNNVTTYIRDANGNLITITDPLNNSTRYAYNSKGLVTSVQNALGKTTSFSYDTYGNLIQIKDAMGGTTTFNYDSAGNIIKSTDARGNSTDFVYDKLNELTEAAYADGSSITYTYDDAGNRVSMTDADNNATDYTFDQLHQLTSQTNALGYKIDYTYDTEGNLISVTDQNNNRTDYEYDSLNRLISKTDALNNKTQYQYDAAGNRTALIDAKGQTINFQYDPMNRLIRVTSLRGDGTAVDEAIYAYDSLGRRATMTDSRGATNYTYDNLNRLLSVDGPGSNDTISYAYDAIGNRLSLTDPDGKVTGYSYDALNRLSTVADSQNKITSYIYDNVGNPVSLVYPNYIKGTYVYDKLNRITRITQQKTSKPSATLSEITYVYDKLGRKTRVKFLDKSYITYTYDALGQLLKEGAVAYEYDHAGNRTRMINKNLDHKYIYNSLNELIEEDIHDTAAKTTKITVKGTVTDASGVKSVTVNGRAAVLSKGNFTCAGVGLKEGANTITVKAMDSLGNSSTKLVHVTFDPTKQNTYTYDNNGNLTGKRLSGNTVNLTYDERNMLTGFSAPGVTEAYKYDGDGRRITVTSNSNAANYIYDGLNVIAERTSGGSTFASYLRNPSLPGGIGGIISRQAGTGGTPQYYQYDGLGSVINMTNSQGAVAQTYKYDAFGNVTKQSGAVTNSRKFLTKETDASGLVYFGARYYDPSIGRFITQDPLGIVDGPNLYAYCRNNPVNWVDPWGLCRSGYERWGDTISDVATGLNAAALASLLAGPVGLLSAELISSGASAADAAALLLYLTDVANGNTNTGGKAIVSAVSVILDLALSSSVAVKPALQGSQFYSRITGQYLSRATGMAEAAKSTLVSAVVDIASRQVTR